MTFQEADAGIKAAIIREYESALYIITHWWEFDDSLLRTAWKSATSIRRRVKNDGFLA